MYVKVLWIMNEYGKQKNTALVRGTVITGSRSEVAKIHNPVLKLEHRYLC